MRPGEVSHHVDPRPEQKGGLRLCHAKGRPNSTDTTRLNQGSAKPSRRMGWRHDALSLSLPLPPYPPGKDTFRGRTLYKNVKDETTRTLTFWSRIRYRCMRTLVEQWSRISYLSRSGVLGQYEKKFFGELTMYYSLAPLVTTSCTVVMESITIIV